MKSRDYSLAVRGTRWAAVAMVLAGCGADDGAPGLVEKPEEDALLYPQGDRLPEPAVRRVDPARTPEQRRRQLEGERYLARQYREAGYRIVATTQTDHGDTIDFLDPATVPGSLEQPPPLTELQLPPGVELAKTEFELYPELRGPEGTVAYRRPRFDAYVLGEADAISLEDFIASAQAQPQPSGQKRLYAGYFSKAANKGAVTYVNAFNGPPIEAGTLSLLELAVYCPGSYPEVTLEQIGIAISRDKINFAYPDNYLRVQVEFLTAGEITGHNKGGWHESLKKYTGFVKVAGPADPPGMVIWGSSVNGPQWEHYLAIQLYAGNWWIRYNNVWLGYYPGGLFDQIPSSACYAAWYGEVFDPTPTTWTKNDIGSGQWASAGYGKAAYFREPYYYGLSGAGYWPTSPQLAPPYNAACYTVSPIFSSAPGGDWERYFYVGGPGGWPDAPSCY